MSVGFSVHSVQCQSTERRLSSMQVVCSISSVSEAVYRVESVAYIVNGVQCYLGYSLRRSWSAYYYSVSVVFSLALSCKWGSESVAFTVSSVSVAFKVCTVQWVILRLYSSVSAVFRALAVHQESVMFRVHTLKVLCPCPCAVLEF